MAAIVSDITYTDERKKTKREREERKKRKWGQYIASCFISKSKSFREVLKETSTSHWPELYYIAIPSCKVGWISKHFLWG